MRIFLYEHITGGGYMSEPLPTSLAKEGDMMLRTLANDLTALPDVEIFTTRDPRLAPLEINNVLEFPVQSKDHACRIFHHCSALAQYAWPIAPETDGVLEKLSHVVQESSCRLIGSTAQAVHIASSKFKTAQWLSGYGLPTIPIYRHVEELPSHINQIVVKPDDGAGCINTILLSRMELEKWWAINKGEKLILQPYIHGDSKSLSLLFNEEDVQVLSCNRQQVHVKTNQFQFHGVDVNAYQDHRGRYQALAEQIRQAIPGLWGYVGVDIIENSQGTFVVDINPRLTTSYVGLSEALNVNVAGLILDLLQPTPTPRNIAPGKTVFIETYHA